MNNTINANKYLKLYISILFIFSIFYLHEKYNVGNDSTISEWLINYEGGFTKRGLIGQIAIYISEFSNYSLKFVFSLLITLLISFLLIIQPDLGQTLIIGISWMILISG